MEQISISPANGRKIKTNRKLLGACFDKSKNKWMSCTKRNKKFVFLGCFDTEIEAHQKYLEFWEEVNKNKEILPENTKRCSKCVEIKDFSQFHKNKNSPDGHYSWCKDCKSKKWKGEYGKNLRKKRYINNKEKIKKQVKEYNNKNKVKVTESKRKNKNKRLKTNPLFKLSENIRCLIYSGFKNKRLNKTSKTRDILGCSFEEFEQHLILSAIRNYGIYYEDFRLGNCEPNFKYQIDHIVPISTAETEDDVVRLNHYTNLQWLTAEDNNKKRDSLNFNTFLEGKTSSIFK